MIVYTSRDNAPLALGRAFVLDGIAYPANWLELASAEDLATHGITATVLPDPPPAEGPGIGIVPTVTPRQARLALLGAGLLDQVQAAVDDAGGAPKITWEFATVFERNSPLIASIGGALGLSEEQIDALFATAATL